ncbi:adenosylmethionine--8-amino-7-oxononanoate transaminase [Kordiimonas sp. SCSIO 12610]|uniref:adenosylmethionine--8-amino-7-oxononanoate transaminase n=1 Tax=Kordiimonas sp. SCSIO 12610 TaxID=2829597 RepID=UPI002109B9B3|nr:adenosylmethionine--8-amino-7-oxononanoate transaminase [Kordiimonas sp. SCSIO 12610]UTW55198.1 adenosylmethionine--8-amino-7-oxononanoate transaminase [Kordiimonas sp. SCSIO 12610]
MPETQLPDWYHDGIDHIWLPYTQMQTAKPPLPVIKSDGVRLTLADGRELVDGIASWWAAAHGYNHPHVLKAVETQLKEMPHVMFGGLVNEPALRLSKRLAAMLPGDLDRCFIAESGSVSVEVAMKMAVQYFLNKGESRSKFVHFRGCYHGDTLGTMGVCDPEEGMHNLFGDVIADNILCDLPRTEAEAAKFTIFLKKNAHTIAAVITEPLVLGAGGMIFYPPETLKWLRSACDEAGVLLIIDEIFTGFCRTGTMFAVEQAGIVPDMITLSKALSGGVSPLSVCAARDHIFDAFLSEDPTKALMHGPTYMAHALGCAAANASLDLFEREDRLGQVAKIEQQLKDELAPCRDLPNVKDVRVKGAIGVVQLHDASNIDALKPKFVDAGVWIRPFRDIVYLTPSLTISAEDLSILTNTIFSTLNG